MHARRRALVWAIVIAAGLGFGAGWFARVWSETTPETRMHEAAETIRKRVRELTH